MLRVTTLLNFFAVRAASMPSRNGLFNANKTRNADMVEALFWKVLHHLQNQFPGFGSSGRYKGLLRRFKKTIHSTLIPQQLPR